MWAYQLTAPRTFERTEVPTLGPADLCDGEVLLRVQAGGICGSDLPVYKGHDSLARPDGHALAAHVPGYPMHEVAGEVVASRDPSLSVGQRVVGWATRHRALAELAITAGSAVHAYRESLSPVQAVQLQTLACVLDSLDRCPPATQVKRAAVLGLGPIGLLFARVLAFQGAAHVEGVDIVDRRAIGPDFGLTRTTYSSLDRWVTNLRDDERPDLVIEAIGHQTGTLASAIQSCAPRGFVNLFGVPDVDSYPLPLDSMLRKNLTLFAGFVDDRRRWLDEAERLVLSRPEILDGYATDVFSADDVPRAFEAACSPRPDRVKVVIDFGTGGGS